MSGNTKQNTTGQIRDLLQKAKQEGSIAEVMSIIQDSFTEVSSSAAASATPERLPITSGAMTDACKRSRGTEPAIWSEYPDWEVAEPKASGPPALDRTLPADVPRTAMPVYHNGLPNGITSMEHWSRTLCELPKVKGKRASYAELVRESEDNEDLANYLTRFVLRHNGPSPKVRDLRKFLEAINYPGGHHQNAYTGAHVPNAHVFPGAPDAIRRLKN